MATQTERPPATHAVPRLEAGDRLTAAEFERRYEAAPEIRKAELIEGEVFVPSPVRHGPHGRPNAKLIAWLDAYETATPGTEVSTNATVRLDDKNVLQPDGLLFISPDRGGAVRFSEDEYIEGPPELAAEVSASSAPIDLDRKLRAYQQHGVREYVVWRVLDGAVDWFALRDGQYRPLPADAAGVVRSEVFPGLWLDTAALVRLDSAAVLRTLQAGLADPAHAAFVARLAGS